MGRAASEAVYDTSESDMAAEGHGDTQGGEWETRLTCLMGLSVAVGHLFQLPPRTHGYTSQPRPAQIQ